LILENAETNAQGHVVAGMLVAKGYPSHRYPIIKGIPRFVPYEGPASQRSVDHFGDQWNHFNFDKYRFNWENHVVKRSFGSTDFYKGKVVVDAGAGSGMMSRWISESGARQVIALELSHSVDDVMQRNLGNLPNVDIVQCTIDNLPFCDGAVVGLVGCTNVIQHTPSVEGTARELWRITGQGGEMAFTCYGRDDSTLARRVRHNMYTAVRGVVSKLPFWGIMGYAWLMSALRLIPVVGGVVEKADFMRRGELEQVSTKWWNQIQHNFQAGVINTFDYFGSHAYQHHRSLNELQALADELQPERAKQVNHKIFFVTPQPAGIMLRLKK
jgi:ubiquinone/menaquinone biosynthesis C-methylase UbiE